MGTMTLWTEFRTTILPLVIMAGLLGGGYYAHRQVVASLERDKTVLIEENRQWRTALGELSTILNTRGYTVPPFDGATGRK